MSCPSQSECNPGEIAVVWREDGSAVVYGRIVSHDGTGESIVGEGKGLKQADLSSITFTTYEDGDPTTSINSGTVTISAAVYDTLQTSSDDPVWTFDRGFNFRHVLTPANFPTGGKTYVVEYKFTTTGGTVGWAIYRGEAKGVHTS